MNTFNYRHRKAIFAIGGIVIPAIAQSLLGSDWSGNWSTLLAFALSFASILYLISYPSLINERLIVSGHSLTIARRIGRSRIIDLDEVERMVIREVPGSLGFGKSINMHLHLPRQPVRIELSHLRDAPAFVRLIESKLRQGGLRLAQHTDDNHHSMPLKELDELLG